MEHIDFDEKRSKLINFKTILKDKHTIDTYTNELDLKEKLEMLKMFLINKNKFLNETYPSSSPIFNISN